MNKICLFIRSLANGGAENQSIILSEKFSSSNVTKLVSIHEFGYLILKAKKKLAPDILFFLQSNNIIRKSFQFFLFLRKHKIQILICYLPFNNIIGIIVGRLAGVPIIFGGLRGSKIKESKLKMIVQRFLMNRLATAVISNSYKAKNTYSDFGVNKDKIHVIHNAFDTDTKPLIRKNKDVIKVLSVGRFVEEKDYLTAIKAFKIFLNNHMQDKKINIKYIIVGYGKLETHIKNIINDLGLDDHIDLIINCFELDKIYQEADIFLLTSRDEGMPYVIMEAMNWSLPVVTTNAGDASYLVLNNESGFVCKVSDFYDIAEKLNILVNQPELRTKMGCRGYNILKDNFSSEIMCNKYYELFKLYG